MLAPLILPFGLIPVFLFIVWVLWLKLRGTAEMQVLSKTREGITEFPHAISLLLYGTDNKNELAFSADGRQVILTLKGTDRHNMNSDDVVDYLVSRMGHENPEAKDWARHYVVTEVEERDDITRVTVEMPADLAVDDGYIEHEVHNMGRVFVTNSGNGIRWLQYPQGERRVERRGDRLFAHIDRRQIVPGLIDSTEIKMSERQITRNLRNRLWNRAEVRVVSVDDTTYVGEIVRVL